jgi:hypothetical protein
MPEHKQIYNDHTEAPCICWGVERYPAPVVGVLTGVVAVEVAVGVVLGFIIINDFLLVLF